jgi:hypothetical protein
MKKMFKNQKDLKNKFYTKHYINGQLGVYIHDHKGEPLAELSIMHDSIELAPNEFILKDYSENEDLINQLIETELIHSSNRFVLVGTHLCPICQIAS